MRKSDDSPKDAEGQSTKLLGPNVEALAYISLTVVVAILAALCLEGIANIIQTLGFR